MKKIIKNGVALITVNKPSYVKLLNNGCFALCEELEAQGLVIDGEVFHIEGKPALEGKETVNLVEVSETYNALEVKKKAEESNLVNAITFVTLAETGNIDEVTAGEHIDLFGEWVSGVSYAVGNIRRYNGKLYKCIQEHTSQADWTPDAAVSLWANISDPAEEYPLWAQPIGSHDAYMLGDKVTYNEKKWTSTVDNNVWKPGEYGWDEVTE